MERKKEGGGEMSVTGLYAEESGKGKGLPEGIAVIKRFINSIADTEIDSFVFGKREYQDIPVSGAGRFYVLEKMLGELTAEDIVKMGERRMIPFKVNYIKPVPPKKNYDLAVEYLNLDTVNVFFRSLENNGGKSIAVLYQTGKDYENVKQRIVAPDADIKDGDGVFVNYCFGRSVLTTGGKKEGLIHDLTPKAAKNLTLFLGMSERYVRAARFDELWEMCRATS